jgi:hypothetical protein
MRRAGDTNVRPYDDLPWHLVALCPRCNKRLAMMVEKLVALDEAKLLGTICWPCRLTLSTTQHNSKVFLFIGNPSLGLSSE